MAIETALKENSRWAVMGKENQRLAERYNETAIKQEMKKVYSI
jgi:hypothetical protein